MVINTSIHTMNIPNQKPAHLRSLPERVRDWRKRSSIPCAVTNTVLLC